MNSLDEISRKLMRLSDTTVSKPLAPMDASQLQIYSSQNRRFNEILEALDEVNARLSQPSDAALLGVPASSAERKRAEYLIRNITKPNPVDTVNSLFDVYFRYKDGGLTSGEAEEYNKISYQACGLLADCESLQRLSERIELPPRKRPRIKKLAALYLKPDSEIKDMDRHLTEIHLLKNEIQDYLHEVQNEKDYQLIIKKYKQDKDIGGPLTEFCSIRISDLVTAPILKARTIDDTPVTVFGLLDGINSELFAIKSDFDTLSARLLHDMMLARSELNNIRAEVSRMSREIKNLGFREGQAVPVADDNEYDNILGELSSLKDDIRAALSFNKDE